MGLQGVDGRPWHAPQGGLAVGPRIGIVCGRSAGLDHFPVPEGDLAMIGNPLILLATPRDAEEIAQMAKADIEHGLPWGWTPSRVLRSMADSATNVAVVRQGDGLAAFGIMKYRDDVAHLLLLAVRSRRRRCGLGSALLVWLETVAQTAAIATVRVETRAENAAGRAFYRRHGYEELGTVAGMYSGIKDGVRMKKELFVPKDPSFVWPGPSRMQPGN
jgi:ribosomal-protein-alanine N-acetyltransferase